MRQFARCKVTGKIKYPTQTIASLAAGKVWSESPYEVLGDMNSFECEHCGQFHIGHFSKYRPPIKILKKSSPSKEIKKRFNTRQVGALKVALKLIDEWLS